MSFVVGLHAPIEKRTRQSQLYFLVIVSVRVELSKFAINKKMNNKAKVTGEEENIGQVIGEN